MVRGTIGPMVTHSPSICTRDHKAMAQTATTSVSAWLVSGSSSSLSFVCLFI